jgi:hypothetical protein
MPLVVKHQVLHLCAVGDPRADEPQPDAPLGVPMSSREPIDVEADVIAAHAAGLDIEEICGIYRLERTAVEEILAGASPDAARPRRSRWLFVVPGRRRRRGTDTPRSAAS